jgi:hypothetical protein
MPHPPRRRSRRNDELRETSDVRCDQTIKRHFANAWQIKRIFAKHWQKGWRGIFFAGPCQISAFPASMGWRHKLPERLHEPFFIEFP